MTTIFSLLLLKNYTTLGGILLFFIIIYYIINKIIQKHLNLSQKYSEFKANDDRYKLFFLFFAFTVPLFETLLYLFDVRVKNYMIFNYSIGAILLILYFLYSKSTFVSKNAYPFFASFYLIYFGYICNTVFFEPYEFVSYVTFILSFFIPM